MKKGELIKSPRNIPWSKNDYVTVNKGGNHNQFIITSNASIFKNNLVAIHVNKYGFTVTVPSIDYIGKSLHPSKRGNMMQITSSGESIPIGKFEADLDESNEDQLVIYFDNE